MTEVLRPLSETEDTVSVNSEDRQGRPMMTSGGSLRRRDSSWDKKWQEHVEKSVMDMPRSSIFSRSPRLPGKVNRSLWEQRSDTDLQDVKYGDLTRQVVTTTPTGQQWVPPSDVIKRQTSASPVCVPHYGAALMDYSSSPARVATPPYPSSHHTASSCSEEAPPPPPFLESNYEDKPLPPPPHENGHESLWKDEVKDILKVICMLFAYWQRFFIFATFFTTTKYLLLKFSSRKSTHTDTEIVDRN